MADDDKEYLYVIFVSPERKTIKKHELFVCRHELDVVMNGIPKYSSKVFTVHKDKIDGYIRDLVKRSFDLIKADENYLVEQKILLLDVQEKYVDIS